MATDSEIRKWLRDQGEQVSVKGPLGAKARAKYAAAHGEQPGPRRLPNPGDLDDLPPEEFGTVDVDVPERESPGPGPSPADGPPPEPPGEDEPPGHTREDWKSTGKRGGKTRARLPRVTQAVRGDIDAKISFALEIPGRVWQARDPVCGGVFVEQRPEIASALTEIVCQSPDLVAWFAGGGGQFMLWLNVMAALWPVVTVVMAHHVYHSIEAAPEAGDQPDYRQYAA